MADPLELTLTRRWLFETCTIGELPIGANTIYTLEDRMREKGVKVWGETCIPEGRYKLDITFSPKFRKQTPILEAVPNYTYIRIHTGNTDAETEGCVLVGMEMGDKCILRSRVAFELLMRHLRQYVNMYPKGEMWLTIKTDPEADFRDSADE